MNITEFYIALAVGVVLSLLVEEFVGVSCGGIIVPGYLAMICDDVLSMLVVFIIALITYFIVELILPRFVILYGKRRFIACLLVGLILKLVADLCVPVLPFATLAFRGVGVVTTGLIANTSIKQGIHITIPAVLVATYVTFGLVQLLLLFV
ncbi:MAG: poly-gamma-glutamate biosynthesis protein PgsC [Oscillospiraceae bacterium]|nr:poly-gamma-glutamate biosynthesis protein PgsC [Oscillospiraceae bacterium]